MGDRLPKDVNEKVEQNLKQDKILNSQKTRQGMQGMQLPSMNTGNTSNVGKSSPVKAVSSIFIFFFNFLILLFKRVCCFETN